eukprot:gene23336-30585_t
MKRKQQQKSDRKKRARESSPPHEQQQQHRQGGGEAIHAHASASFRLGASMRGDCQTFTSEDLKGGSVLLCTDGCDNCGQAAASHVLHPSRSEACCEHQLLCAIRNMRTAIMDPLTNARVHGILVPLFSSAAFRQARTKLSCFTELSNALQTVQTLSKIMKQRAPTPEERINLLMALDDAYNWLYYGASTNRKQQLLPSPAHYFGTLAWDPRSAKEALASYRSLFGHPPDWLTGSDRSNDDDDDSVALAGACPKLLHSNPLLALCCSRWLETLLLFQRVRYPDNWTDLSSEKKPPSEMTLKKADPLCFELLRKWRDNCRDFAARFYAFAVPNEEALDCMMQHTPIVELGAGTGYWASLLRQRSETKAETKTITALDVAPPQQQANEYHGKVGSHTLVERGVAQDLQKPRFQGQALFLCYPPPDSEMALDALRCSQGDVVLYVGEWNGDTGTAAFQSRLANTFTCTQLVALPNWGNTCYTLSVWKRGSQSIPVHISCCCICQADNASHALYRCRMSCAVSFCKQGCQQKGLSKHRMELAARHLLPLLPTSPLDKQVGRLQLQTKAVFRHLPAPKST